MSTLYAPPTPEDVAALVLAEIRAWMGRKRLNQSQLAAAIDMKPSQMSKRLSGQVPIDLIELGKISAVLGVEPKVLFGAPPTPGGPGDPSNQRVGGSSPSWRTRLSLAALPVAA